MKTFIKRFHTTPYEEIRKEARLQRKAAAIGVAPRVIRCTQTTIVMERIDSLCIADQYGEVLEDLPQWIRDRIVEILYQLRTTAGIEYLDVSPYNFIEKDDVVWVIDFGHAREIGDEPDPYLDDVIASWTLSAWNPTFK